jgi:hypothetical protein
MGDFSCIALKKTGTVSANKARERVRVRVQDLAQNMYSGACRKGE